MRSLLTARSASADAFPVTVGSIYRDGARVWNPSYSLGADAECWEKAWQDEVVSGAIERRMFGVCGEWRLDPATDDEADVLLASILEEVLREGLPGFVDARFNLARSAFVGMGWADVTGGFRMARVHDGRDRRWWVPGRLRDVDFRMFSQVAVHDKATDSYRIQWRRYSPARKRWEPLDQRRPMVRIVRFDRQSSLGFGTGILDSIYKVLYLRGEVQRLGMQGLRRWAVGILHGQIDATAVGGKDNTAEAARDALREELRKQIEDHVLVTDKRDAVSVVTGGIEGHQIVTAWLDRIEKDAIVRIEGSYLPSGGDGSGGAYALGKEQSEVQQDSREIDRLMLADALTGGHGAPSQMGLVRFALHMNRQVLAEIDQRLATARCPRFAIVRQRLNVPDERVTTIERVAALGGRVSLKTLHEMAEVPMAEEGEECVEAPSSAAMLPGAPQTGSFGSTGVAVDAPFSFDVPANPFDAILRGERPPAASRTVEAGATSAAPAVPSQRTPAEEMQDRALNGAQVSSLLELVASLVEKRMPPDAAVELILAAFPLVGESRARRIVESAAGFQPATTPEVAPADGSHPTDGADGQTEPKRNGKDRP